MFVDEARIAVAGGEGGNGALSFRREKFVPRGGPDGGNGGDGGSVVLVADAECNTLLAFRYHTQFVAERGRHGEGARKTGRSGASLEVKVPPGTLVKEADGSHVLADLAAEGDRFVAARGGRGGRGNACFATSTNRAPRRHEPGQPGESRVLALELKLLADVGLVGFPNVGKSTLLARISAARPKIADYPFTTLAPQLGVVDAGDYRSFVVADLPGLIEGAHHGAGLGLRFLRHIERCRLLLHLVDPTAAGRDPVADVRIIQRELRKYRAGLERRPQVLVLTKADAAQDTGPGRRLAEYAAKRQLPLVSISAVTGGGVADLVRLTAATLSRLRRRPRAAASSPATARGDRD
jgi:GTP-binding protein